MDILEYLASEGLRCSRNGDKLLVEPRSKINDDLAAIIRAHKPAILKAIEGERTYRNWRVILPNRQIEFAVIPAATRAEIIGQYPQALTVEPIGNEELARRPEAKA